MPDSERTPEDSERTPEQLRHELAVKTGEASALWAEVERLRAKTVEYVATTSGERLRFHVVDHGTSLTVYVHDDAS